MPVSKPEVDIVNTILEDCIMAYPVSSFVISLYKQYVQRGSLSKKQLQGLYGKASKIEDLSPGKLATLEALIKKMPTRFKSELPPNEILQKKDDGALHLIDQILTKYPQHKRVLFLKAKHENNGQLTTIEIAELKKFIVLLKL
ncbi:MAG: hypothetical protein ABIR81_00825 [Ginsengibacter sp.]